MPHSGTVGTSAGSNTRTVPGMADLSLDKAVFLRTFALFKSGWSEDSEGTTFGLSIKTSHRLAKRKCFITPESKPFGDNGSPER